MTQDISRSNYTISISNAKHYLILFILWPFLSFIVALVNYNNKESRRVVYIFLVYYGLTFVNNNQYIDAYRYILNFKAVALIPASAFMDIFGGLYTDSTVDIIEPLLTFIISRFTSHGGVYFAIWSVIFGFFYLKSVNLLYDRYQDNPNWTALLALTFFILLLPITKVTGIRMPIATWMFFLGAYHVVLYRDLKFLILTLVACLMHWSFLTANVILIVYVLLGNRNLVYIPMVILSFILPSIVAPLFQVIAFRIGGPIQQRFEGYTSEGYNEAIQQSAETASWFMVLGDKLVFYFLLIAILVIQITGKSQMKENSERNLFSFLLLFLTFVNFGQVIPTFGNRFKLVFFLFATLYLFIFFLKDQGKTRNILAWAGLLPMLIYAAINLRMGSETISVWILTPGVGLPLLVPGLSIAEVLFY